MYNFFRNYIHFVQNVQCSHPEGTSRLAPVFLFGLVIGIGIYKRLAKKNFRIKFWK
jgi:hypothetical protein